MKGKEFDTKNAPISFIDLEMTGLESAKHEIVEIGLVKAFQPGLEVMETWEAKVRPEHLETADPEALKISGYDPEKWKEAISLEEMMAILSEKSRGTILAGFVPFADYAFLDAAVTRTGIPLDFHRRTLDVHTYVVAKMGYDRNESGLSFLCQKLGISPGNHHTAMADAMACYEVYKRVATDKV
ncbi:MAG: 3'-5' exonuclease [bacterium]|nr:3'-5' exonuclease [bacterium]